MLSLDVNILVYAHRKDFDEHEAYAAWLTNVLEGPEPLGLSELVMSAFLRIVTNKKIFKVPTPSDVALKFIANLVESSNVVRLRPAEHHFEIFLELCEKHSLTGNLVPDAYHAALAIENGCEWVTNDPDFQRFSQLRIRHPLTL